MRKKCLAILAVLIAASGTVFGQDAEEIMGRIDERQQAESSRAKMTMIIRPVIGSNQGAREFRIIIFSRGAGSTYMEFASPQSIRGLRILEIEGDTRVYFPSTGRIRRITGSQKSGSVGGIGGDFSYQDLGTGNYTEEYSLSMEGQNSTEWIIRGIPADKDSSYSRLLFYVGKEKERIQKIEYFTEKDGRIKTLFNEEFRDTGDVETPAKMRMVNHVKKQETIIEIAAYETGITLDDKYFNPNRFYR